MTEQEVAALQTDLEGVLPDNFGYILIGLPIGVPAAPTFIANMEPEDSVNVLRAILSALENRERDASLN
jgi:hypothetical protein